MKKHIYKGGIESIVAIVVIVGLVSAILLAVVVPMSQEGDSLINTATNKLVENQGNIGPQ